MAYKKRYYKKRARKYYRKYKTLSKRNIFSRKNAKSQASQIYALNKRITKLEKRTKPEIDIYYNYDITQFHNSFTGDATDTNTGYMNQYPLVSLLHSLSAQDPDRFAIQKDLIRIQDFKLYFKFSRSEHSKPFDILGRITILKVSKVSSNRDMIFIHNVGSSLTLPNSTPYVNLAGNMSNIVNGPLNENITTYGKIVYDKKFKMKGSDDAQKTLQRRVKLYGQTIRKSSQNAWPDLLTNDYVICLSVGFVPLAYADPLTLTADDVICTEVGTKITYIDEALKDPTQ